MRAFEQLVLLHRNRILADCRYLTRDQANAEDLAQDVFVKAYFALNGFEGRSSFRHWLQRIKVNHCLNHLKKRDGRDALSIADDSAEFIPQLRVEPGVVSDLDAGDRRARIRGILDSMPESLRVPLVMCDMDEMSYEEIAAALNLGLSAVKMRIKRARELFRQLYQAGPQA